MSTSAFIKCDCNNNCYPVDPCSTSTKCKPASEVCYSGPALFCSGILPNDNLNVALQKIDSKLCGEALVINVFDEIINNPTLYQQFVDLVNGAIDCEVINNCIPTTTTTTTTCFNPNLLVNGSMTSNITGWNDLSGLAWEWSSFNGGSANFIDSDNINNLLFQDVLTPGETYDITFDFYDTAPCTEFAYLTVYVGDTVYGPLTAEGTINLTLTCTNSPRFGFQGYDACGDPNNNIFVNNVSVSLHCPQFTTTSTTTIL